MRPIEAHCEEEGPALVAAAPLEHPGGVVGQQAIGVQAVGLGPQRGNPQ
jgi:hypothetical protein